MTMCSIADDMMYLDLALSFVESKEIRDCWRVELPNEPDMLSYHCREIILKSRATIEPLDCCYGWCIFVDGKGNLQHGAIKHNLGEAIAVSPVYRVERFSGELPEHEKPLEAIAKAILATPNREFTRVCGNGEILKWHDNKTAWQFREYIFNADIGDCPCPWPLFAERFGLERRRKSNRKRGKGADTKCGA